MAEFADLDEFFDGTLKLPVGGKVYVIQPPDAAVGVLIMSLVSGALEGSIEDVFPEDEERNLYRRALGSTYDELIADGVDWARLQHIGQTALAWIAAGEDAAAMVWAAPSAPGSPGKAPKRPADRKPAKRPPARP